jgi:hypothetical protein
MGEKRPDDPVLFAMKTQRPYLRSTALIMVMQAADFRNLNYLPQFRFLNGTRLR